LSISLLSKAATAWIFFTKDFKNTYRFRSALAGQILSPFLGAISLLVTYSAVFYVGGVEDIAYVNKQNYVVYLMTGFLALTFVSRCWGGAGLNWEKIMMTLDGIFLAPVNRLWILLGKSLNVLFSVGLSAIPYILILVVVRAGITSYLKLAVGIAGLFLMLAIFISIDFVISGISLSEEGYASIIRTWLPRGVSLFSCVYYPVDVFPKLLRPFAYLNPAYHGVSLFRSAFIEGGISHPLVSIVYLLLLGTIGPPVAVWFFETLFKRYGVRGY